MEITIDSRILNKVLLVCQKNSTKLDQISRRQDEMEAMMVEQNNKIDQILSKFEVQNNADKKEVKDKGKKTQNEFYQVNICFIINSFCLYYLYFNYLVLTYFILQAAIRKLSYEVFHEHKQITDNELKARLKAKLDGDEYCANQLRKLQDNGVSYDELWDEKLYSVVSVFIYIFYIFSCHIICRLLTSNNLFE